MLRKIKYHSFAFAKVNLTLRILSKLKNGYHRIQSFIIFLNLKDKIQLTESDLRYDKIIFKEKFGKGINKSHNTISKLLKIIRAKGFLKSSACHSIAQGGANKIGPALWGVLGRKSGSVSGYKYSKAMAAHGKNWSFEEMNGFLIKPKEWIKGTKMSFAGLKNAKDRAAVILYMNENTDSPLPLE